jgi:hypothetical protein
MSDIEELAHLLDMPGGDLDWGAAVDGEPFCFLEYEQTGELTAAAAAAFETVALGALPGGQQEQQQAQESTASRTRPRL